MPLFSPSVVTRADLDAATAAMQQKIPAASSATPPAVSLTGTPGTASQFARADHTHQSSVQAVRAQLTLSGGMATFTYPAPYASGVVPVVEACAETPSGQAYRLDCSIIQGSVTNASCQVAVWKTSQAVTLPGLATALLNFVVNIFAAQTGTAYVHFIIRAPTL